MCIKCTPSSVDEFMSENIHYNINIIRGWKVVCNRGWLANGIPFTKTAYEFKWNFFFFSFKEFSNQFPHVKTNFLVQEGIIAATREYKKLGTAYN